MLILVELIREIIVVHPDAEFLDDKDKRLLMKSAKHVSTLIFFLLKTKREVREMSQQDILRFEEAGKVTIAGQTLELTDIKVSSSHPMLFSFNEEYAVTLFLSCVVQIVRVFKRYG
ncbi:hypothetical protein YC2023_097673 [Brassica napus]